MQVVTAGDAVVDWLAVRRGETFLNAGEFFRCLGGNTVNVAVGLSRLGTKTRFMGKVGQDIHGDYVKSQLMAEGIDLKYLYMDKLAPTAQCYAFEDQSGHHLYYNWPRPHAAQKLSCEDIVPGIFEGSCAFHTSGISLSLEPRRAAIIKAMNLANSLGIINSFDANIPPDVEEKEKLAIQDAFKKSQIIKLNERELFYWSKDDLCQGIETVAQRFFERFELIVLLITLGAEGSLLVTARDVIHCPAIPVESICGVGAGDGYLAGVIHMLMKKTEANMSKDNLMRLSAEAWREVGMYGNAVGALVTTGYGAVPSMPRSEKVEGLLKSFGSLNRK